MKNFNLKNIMKNAHKFVKKLHISMSEALKKSWQNAKAIKLAKELAGIKEECHTWYSWKELGFEVAHESKCLFQVTVFATTKKGTQVLSYFGKSQVSAMV